MNTFKDPIAFRLQIRKVLGITLLWMLVGSLLFWYERSLMAEAGCAEPELNVLSAYLIALVSTSIAGIVGGSSVCGAVGLTTGLMLKIGYTGGRNI